MVYPGSAVSFHTMPQPTPKLVPHGLPAVAAMSPFLEPTGHVHVPDTLTVTVPLELVVTVPVWGGALTGAGPAKAGVAPRATSTIDANTTVMARPAMRRGAWWPPDK